jgi:hypothetical protein
MTKKQIKERKAYLRRLRGEPVVAIPRKSDVGVMRRLAIALGLPSNMPMLRERRVP